MLLSLPSLNFPYHSLPSLSTWLFFGLFYLLPSLFFVFCLMVIVFTSLYPSLSLPILAILPLSISFSFSRSLSLSQSLSLFLSLPFHLCFHHAFISLPVYVSSPSLSLLALCLSPHVSPYLSRPTMVININYHLGELRDDSTQWLHFTPSGPT